MRRLVLVFTLVAGFAMAHAQDLFVGGGVSLVVIAFEGVGVAPTIGFQVGGSVADDLYLRGTLDTLPPFAFFIGGDVLYAFPLEESQTDVYVGGGPDVLVVTLLGWSAAFGVHATAGVEFDAGAVGIYLEAQPAVIFGAGGTAFFGKVRSGVNFHF